MKFFVKNIIYILCLVIYSVSDASISFADSPTQSLSKKESIKKLENILEDGGFNSKLFELLAVKSNLPEKKLAYARQGIILDPSNKIFSTIIKNARLQIKNDSLLKDTQVNSRLISLFSIKSYLPFFIIDYSIIVISISVFILSLIKRRSYFFNILLSLLLLLTIDKLLITYDQFGNLKFIESRQEIIKSEAIALSSINAYSAKNTKSQLSFVAKAGSELDILSNNPQKNEWVRVKLNKDRLGWVKFDSDKLFLIKR